MWLLLCMTAFADTAQDKASEAAYIQMGVKDSVDKFSSYMEGFGMKYVRAIKAEPALLIISVYNKKELSFPIKQNTVTLKLTEINFTHRW
jgi:hypothetical protein